MTVLPLYRGVWIVWTGIYFYDTCSDTNELTYTVSAYIKYCVDMVIPTKKVIYPNNKPWVIKELKSVINNLGDQLEKKAVSREGKNEIRKAKIQ